MRRGPWLSLVILLAPAHAMAHLGSTKYLEVRVAERAVEVTVAVETIDASMELGLGEVPDEAALARQSDALVAWLVGGIEVEAGDRCEPRGGPVRFATRDGRRHAVVALRYLCDGPPRSLVDDTVFPGDAQHEALVELYRGEAADARVLRRGRQRLQLDEAPSATGLAAAFGFQGAVHFATGYDHVLFLLSLLLSAGAALRTLGPRRALRDVAILVTAFTVGHSVTLIAAALRWVVLPSSWVEVVIAASIVAVAMHNVARPRHSAPMPALAFFFGLVHGFGFSSVLGELGLPPERAVLALLSFNVGIELAQLAFVALAIVPLAWMARSPRYDRWVVQGGSVLIAAVAAYWVAERVPWG